MIPIPTSSCLLSGPTGCGRTSALVNMAHRALSEGRKVAYVDLECDGHGLPRNTPNFYYFSGNLVYEDIRTIFGGDFPEGSLVIVEPLNCMATVASRSARTAPSAPTVLVAIKDLVEQADRRKVVLVAGVVNNKTSKPKLSPSQSESIRDLFSESYHLDKMTAVCTKGAREGQRYSIPKRSRDGDTF